MAAGAYVDYLVCVQVLTLVNQKGGVGKTTVALGLAASAWARQVDCLVIDIDPQGNATTGLGVWNPPFSIDHALAEERPGSIASLRGDLFLADRRWASPVSGPRYASSRSP